MRLVLSRRTLAERGTVGRREIECCAKSVVLLLELGHPVLECLGWPINVSACDRGICDTYLEMCGSSGTEGSLDIPGAVGREIVVAFASTLGGHGGDC